MMTAINAQVTHWVPTGYGTIRLSGICLDRDFWADVQTSWDGRKWMAEVTGTNYDGGRDDLIQLALEVAFN